MKLSLLPDLHIGERQPENRVDNFVETMWRKLKFIFDIAKEHEVDAILQPGDCTHTPFMQWDFFIKVVDFINSFNILMFTVFGNHDLRYRTKGNTALDAIVEACPKFTILDNEHTVEILKGIEIYGVSYGEEIPKPKGSFDILLIHKMIIAEKKLWKGQDDITWSKSFLRKHDFELIISGDNHSTFEANYDDRWLFNNGALLRDSITLKDLRPSVVVFDTVKKTYKRIYVPIEPANKVFNMEKIKEEEERDEKIGAVVEGLAEYKGLGLDFKKNLINYAKKNSSEDVVDLLKRGFEKEVDEYTATGSTRGYKP